MPIFQVGGLHRAPGSAALMEGACHLLTPPSVPFLSQGEAKTPQVAVSSGQSRLPGRLFHFFCPSGQIKFDQPRFFSKEKLQPAGETEAMPLAFERFDEPFASIRILGSSAEAHGVQGEGLRAVPGRHGAGVRT